MVKCVGAAGRHARLEQEEEDRRDHVEGLQAWSGKERYGRQKGMNR
jgi:hypothetical protein